MPLIDENRIIVKHGLAALQNSKKPGIRALIEVSGYQNKLLDTYSVGFGLGPRINAASRVDETKLALDLLMTKDETEAYSLARRLDDLNIRRREEQAKIFEEALAQVSLQDMTDSRCIVVSGTNWTGAAHCPDARHDHSRGRSGGRRGATRPEPRGDGGDEDGKRTASHCRWHREGRACTGGNGGGEGGGAARA